MSTGAWIVKGPSGGLHDSNNGSMYDGQYSGSIWNAALSKATSYVISKDSNTTTAIAALAASNFGEYYTLASTAANEGANTIIATVPSSATNVSGTAKSTVNTVCVTAAVSNFGGGVLQQAVGLVGTGQTATSNTQGYISGIYASALVSASSDATAFGQRVFIINAGGTAVSTLNTALSKVALNLVSSGANKNSAYLYCLKQNTSDGSTAVNCSHGICVDAGSVDANAFAVVSGTTPTVLWAVQPTGKQTVPDSVVTIATQASTAALTTASGMVTITALTCAAATAVSVSCTTSAGLAVTTSSRVYLSIQNQTGSAAGFMVVAADAVTSNAFNIRIGNTTAATAYGGGAFSVAYTIVN